MTRLTAEIVKALPAPVRGNKVNFFAGAIVQGLPAPKGFGVRVTAGGAKSFILNYRLRGRQCRYTIGAFPDWSPLRAVREARTLRQRVDRGENPLGDRASQPETKTVADVLDDFMKRYVLAPARSLRTAREYESVFRRLVKPYLGKLGIHELRRSHVAQMLDRIEDENGPVMADRTRAYFRKALGWYAERDDQFNLNAAIVRVAPRANSLERARTRTLSDEEIRSIWPALAEAGTFGAVVKMLLLTAQRRTEVAHMSRSELGADGVWVIPAERYKAKRPNPVSLSKAALAIIEAQPRAEGCDYVFVGRTKKTPFSGFGKGKVALDKAVVNTKGGHPCSTGLCMI